ncbi:WD40 repeat domain-containing protein [Micromonospora sp. WMMD956]|uniref:WD40 repeat domain-containing protein n=1 Tax=Micromonospora sp. WMMD956 TaxID=3016108 RepID=UPI002417A903|nr:WD40 repeat domain-containing protein [Micromonospora sp. WMMD956]MDG4819604.1 WD40 repeat domain-containing protein [Micromonospora sp. WMMD956]
MRRVFPAGAVCLAVVLAAGTACAAGRTESGPTSSPAAPPPKDFRVTLLSEHAKFTHGVALSSNGERALTSSLEELADPPHGSVTLWDLTDPLRPRATPLVPDRGGTAVEVALSGDGRRAATFHARGELTLWDLADPAHPSPRKLAAKGVTSLALSHDGRYAIAGGDQGVHFWDLADPDQVRKTMLLGTGDPTYSYDVALSDDANRALVNYRADDGGGGDGGVMLYDLSDRSEPEAYALLRNGGYTSADAVALSGDGNTALVGYRHWTTYHEFVTYWDLRTWDKTELRPMTGWKVVPGVDGGTTRGWDLALDHDGKRALITAHDVYAPLADPNPPPSEVQFWALDTLTGFARFPAPG